MAKKNLTILMFTFMNFVLAMMGSVFNGILDEIAISLGISVANAGLLTTMYSYGAAFGVPITLIIFGKIERSKMLKSMLFITILMTSLLLLAQNFGQMLILRLFMGISSFSYNVLAISTVASLSDKERQGRSMAILIAGNASALVIGIPLTRALSSILDWQSIFGILIGIMILALGYFLLFLPASEKETTKLNLKNEFEFFKDRRVLLIIAYTTIMFVGNGAFYTYITPYLLFLFPSIEAFMVAILVLLGIASFIGNLIGGYVSDRIGYAKSMSLGAAFQLVSIVLALLFQQVAWLSVVSALLWIMSVWFTGLQVNTGIIQATQNASSFLISINSSCIQLGTAIGASLAAVVASLGGINNILYIALLSCLSILPVQLFSERKASLQESKPNAD